MTRLFIGADGGGSHTRAVIAGEDFVPKGENLPGKSDWELPVALISATRGLSAEAAADYLSKKKNNVAPALTSPPERDRT